MYLLAFSFLESFEIFISLNFLTKEDYSFIYLYNFIKSQCFLINLDNENMSSRLWSWLFNANNYNLLISMSMKWKLCKFHRSSFFWSQMSNICLKCWSCTSLTSSSACHHCFLQGIGLTQLSSFEYEGVSSSTRGWILQFAYGQSLSPPSGTV